MKISKVISIILFTTAAMALTGIANAAETSAGWRKSEHNPVLGGKLGTCFDVCLMKEGGS